MAGKAWICVVAAAAALAAAIAAAGSGGLSAHTVVARRATAVHISGRRFVDASGHPLVLRGVNFSGAQYECLSPGGRVWDVPADARTLRAMEDWHINAVRVPLNEDCWLGINALPRGYSAARYRRAVSAWVARLNGAGMIVVLNLHVVAPGRRRSTRDLPMADASHAPAFWRSVASRFRRDAGVIFDLYNEPNRIGWRCWRDGCADGYRMAGMQQLLDAVRSVGARQPVVADGLRYADDLRGWLVHAPTDPLHQLAAGFHTYHDGLGCEDRECWKQVLAPIAARVPLLSGEIGEFDCRHWFIDRYMNWADRHGVSYLAWAWNDFSCAREPSLLRTLAGAPSRYGVGLYNHLKRLSRR